MKLRRLPEDFVVQERSTLQLSPTPRAYRAYRLTKQGVETLHLLAHLSRENGIPVREFGIAGLKDKHAVTSQLLTLPATRELLRLHEEHFALEPVGFCDEPLRTGDLSGNDFIITVRDLTRGDLARLEQGKLLVQHGVPNYFDAQRFGSSPGNDFIYEHLLQGDDTGAVRMFLTQGSKSEPQAKKADRRLISAAWPAIAGLRVQDKVFSRVVAASREGFAAAYRAIPENVRELHRSAYQSVLWNECVAALLREALPPRALITVEAAYQPLLFPKRPVVLPASFPLPDEMGSGTPQQRRVIEAVLRRRGVGALTGLRAQVRAVMVHPARLIIEDPVPDELYPRRFKVRMSFSLPKGSYGTIVVKALLGA